MRRDGTPVVFAAGQPETDSGATSGVVFMVFRSVFVASFAVFTLASVAACSSDGSGGSSGQTSSSSSSGSLCSSQSTSQQAYLCVGGRCKCASSKEDKYPYTEEQAKSACSSGTSSGNCPESSSGSTGTSSGGTSGTSGGTSGTSSGGTSGTSGGTSGTGSSGSPPPDEE